MSYVVYQHRNTTWEQKDQATHRDMLSEEASTNMKFLTGKKFMTNSVAMTISSRQRLGEDMMESLG